METQTQTPQTAPVESTETVEVSPPVVNAAPDVAVAVDGVEVEVTDTSGGLELTPVTGLVGVLVLGVVAVLVARLRKK